MNTAELLVVFFLGIVLYRGFRPLRLRLEAVFARFLRTSRKRGPSPVLDITDYSKKEGKK